MSDRTYSSKYRIGDSIILNLDNIKHRNCSIVAIKFEERDIRVDIMLSNGQRLYDINIEHIELTEEFAQRLANSELNNI